MTFWHLLAQMIFILILILFFQLSNSRSLDSVCSTLKTLAHEAEKESEVFFWIFLWKFKKKSFNPFNSINDPELSKQCLAGYYVELQKVLHQIALAGWNYFTAASISLKQNLDEAEEVEIIKFQ